MAEFKGEDFKFPDEVTEKKEDIKAEDIEIDLESEGEIEIEVEDDTPVADRGRKPLDKEVEDPSEDEVEQYSEKVQKRIKELAHARHDERRAKEAALREREEAARAVQQLLDENKRLKSYVSSGEQTYATVLKEKAEAELEMARRRYKEAAESYDSDAMLAAQEALQEAKLRVMQAENFRPPPLQVENEQVYIQPQQQQPQQLDEKTLRWQAKNQWFGAEGFEDMTALAIGMHTRLVNQNGPEYARTDEYFERIDARLREKFPEHYGEEKRETPREASTKKPPATVVAPGTRSSGAKKIRLTKTQEAFARRLGLTNQQYAKEVLKLEASNG
jgi:hypothetical protein